MKLADIDMIAVALVRASDLISTLDADELAYITDALIEAKEIIDRALERVKEAA